MTTHTYPGENWSGQLAVLLEKVDCGDVIRVPSEFAAELVRESLARMRPSLRVEIVVQEDDPFSRG
jgi:hypothetical protein